MPREPNAAKKPYSPPSFVVLDASAAKAKLKAQEGLKDPIVHKMLSLGLRTETRVSGDVIVLCCLGRLVIGEETNAFREEVKKLLSERHRIVLDLSEIEHIDSIGLAGLVGLFTWASSEKREIRLVYSGGHLTDLLRRTRLHKVLTVYTSEQEAIASFSEVVSGEYSARLQRSSASPKYLDGYDDPHFTTSASLPAAYNARIVRMSCSTDCEQGEKKLMADLLKAGGTVPTSGAYKVVHTNTHIPSHYVTAIYGETFPH